MAANGTTVGDLATIASQNQASGRAIFWAMASIVLNAMLQPSFTGYLWSGDTFKDSLWPHRSSPFICLVDAAADIWIMIERYRKPELYSEDEVRILPTTLTMRLAIFVIGVLPQVIKVFSSTGIPITQAITAMFVFATMTSMMRTACSAAPMSDVVCIAERALWKKAPEEKGPDDRNLPSYGEMICWAGTAAHILALAHIWESFFKITHIHSSSEDTNNLLQWISLVVSMLCATYVLQHTACILVTGKWYIPRSGPMFVFGLYTPILFSKLLEHPNSSRHRMDDERLSYWIQVLSFLFHGAALSYVVALALEMLAKLLLHIATSSSHEDSSIPTSEALVSRENPSMTTSSTAPSDDTSVARSSDHTIETNIHAALGALPDSQAPVTEAVGTADVTAIQDVHARLADAESPTPATSPSNIFADTTQDCQTEIDSPAPAQMSTEPAVPAATKRSSIVVNAIGNIICCIAIVPLGFVFFVAAYIDAIPGLGTGPEDDDTTERGEATQHQSQPSNNVETPAAPESRTVMTVLLHISVQPIVLLWQIPGHDRVIRPVIKVISYGVWRVVIAGMSTYGFAFNWVAATVRANTKDRMCVTFGILNVMTAMITYLVTFESQGTYSPPWTSLLGK